jgi:hypothetical protein
MNRNKLRDGRTVIITGIRNNRIWAKLNREESAWNIDGKWRDDGIESCADIIDIKIQYKIFN